VSGVELLEDGPPRARGVIVLAHGAGAPMANNVQPCYCKYPCYLLLFFCP
jgi:predicted alpha/beta-hydrolase family hydrolase